MAAMLWSKPHHGVQHLNGVKADHQVTVADYGSFAILQVFSLHNSPFTTGCTETTHPNAVAARIAGEQSAIQRGIAK